MRVDLNVSTFAHFLTLHVALQVAQAECRIWVKNGSGCASRSCLPYPSKQTSPVSKRKQKHYLAVLLNGRESAWFSLSLAKERDHGRPQKYDSDCEQTTALEQG
jgi:hypothetical protein